MERWEYEITTHPIKEVLSDAERESGVIICDPAGVCLYKDMPAANREVIVKILNQRGSLGWELVETHFNNKSMELIFIWKRSRIAPQMEH